MTGLQEGQEVESLGEPECRRLLSDHSFGRIVFTSGALPAVIPVTYGVMDDMIVVRFSPGFSLRTSLHDSVVALEVDDIDTSNPSGWSIVAVGVANELPDPDRARAVELLSRYPGRRVDGHIIGIFPTTISGHRIDNPS
jgi:nitroimidazol reductase NimA-like FMN-containing flavoprotein (pyridoxamine 5'-phosphate oxidase superfamily)